MLFDRSKPQLQRKVVSKSCEQLETDAAQKEECTLIVSALHAAMWHRKGLHAVQARLSELRNKMSKEKAEVDKLL